MTDVRQRTLVSVRTYLDLLNANTEVFVSFYRADFGILSRFDNEDLSVTVSECSSDQPASEVSQQGIEL